MRRIRSSKAEREKMNIIYELKGKAKEYAPLAANLYRGCSHGCDYCYAPACLRMTKYEFNHPKARPDVLNQLEKNAKKMAGDSRPVLLCFTCDPYQPLEEEAQITRRAIEILGENDMRIRVLTKRPTLAVERDINILKKYKVEFGVSLSFDDCEIKTSVFHDPHAWKAWEPKVSSPSCRIKAISMAKRAGLPTWLSIEPVIIPDQAIKVVQRTVGFVDHYKIGKLNHHPEIEKKIDWRKFLLNVLIALNVRKKSYYIKDDLWKFADEEIRKNFAKEKK